MFQVIFIYVFITWSRFLSKHFCLQPFLYYLLIHYFARCPDGEEGDFEIWFSRSLEPGKCISDTLFDFKNILSIADRHHFPRECCGLVIKCTRYHHPNRCIKIGNKPPRLTSWQVALFFFVTRHDSVSRPCLVQTFFILYMSKHCSVSVIYSQSQEFIFCAIHFHSFHPAIRKASLLF